MVFGRQSPQRSTYYSQPAPRPLSIRDAYGRTGTIRLNVPGEIGDFHRAGNIAPPTPPSHARHVMSSGAFTRIKNILHNRPPDAAPVRTFRRYKVRTAPHQRSLQPMQFPTRASIHFPPTITLHLVPPTSSTTRLRFHRAARRGVHNNHQRKRKWRKENRVILGGTSLPRKSTTWQCLSLSGDDLLNRKRPAASVALEAAQIAKTTQRLLPFPRRRPFCR